MESNVNLLGDIGPISISDRDSPNLKQWATRMSHCFPTSLVILAPVSGFKTRVALVVKCFG